MTTCGWTGGMEGRYASYILTNFDSYGNRVYRDGRFLEKWPMQARKYTELWKAEREIQPEDEIMRYDPATGFVTSIS